MNRFSKQTAILLGIQLAHGAANAEELAFSSFDHDASPSSAYGQDDPDLAYDNLEQQSADALNETFSGTMGSGFVAPNYIFITSASGVGDLSQWPEANGATGAAAGNAICQSEADSAGMPGADEYIAWLSDTNGDAYCRAHGFDDTIANNCGQSSLPTDAGPWLRLDDRFFGGKLPELLELNSPIRNIEFAPLLPFTDTAISKLDSAYTGTNASGFATDAFGTPLDCGGWSDQNEQASVGSSAQFRSSWSGVEGQAAACDQDRSLICLKPGSFNGEPTPPAPQISRKVFVTSSSGPGDLSQWPDANGATGIAAGDQICRAHASRAGLDNADGYRAWLSSLLGDIIDIFETEGPLLTTGGERFVANVSDLSAGFPETALRLDENGSELLFDFQQVWTGTFDQGAVTEVDCGIWTNDSVVLGTVGLSGNYIGWSRTDEIDCFASAHLYCFADFNGEVVFGGGFENFETFSPPSP